VEFEPGIGPAWVHTINGGRTKDSIAGEVVFDFMFWPTRERKFGWFLEPSYSYDFSKGQRSFGVSAGLLIAIPWRSNSTERSPLCERIVLTDWPPPNGRACRRGRSGTNPGFRVLRFLTSLLIFVPFLPIDALGKGGTNMHEFANTRATVPTYQSPFPSDGFVSCVRGRYRDQRTHKCRGPAVFGN
jgi:hypothetical protein